MASLFFEEQYRRYRIRFEYGGVAYNRSLGKRVMDDPEQAKAVLKRVERMLGLLREGVVVMPADAADPARFILSEGKETGNALVAKVRTLSDLFGAVKELTPKGAKEEGTLKTEEIHRKHLRRIIGSRTPLRGMKAATIQAYISSRAGENHRGSPISPDTIRKEVGTLRADWDSARGLGLLGDLGPPPTSKLDYPKDPPKHPFRTWDQIRLVVAQGDLTKAEQEEAWSSLFLRVPEIQELLAYVRETAAHPFIHPMVAFVAYTGARRSEMIRSRVEDIDFAAGLVRLREKKRDRSREITFRHVDLAAPLARVLRAWLAGPHPGGPNTICQPAKTRMKRRPGPAPLTRDEARHHCTHPADHVPACAPNGESHVGQEEVVGGR